MTSAEQPRTVVIGCGQWGKNLVRNLAELNALAAICDPDTAVAESTARLHNVPTMSWVTTLEDKAISAVMIAAPAALHAKLAHQALTAGKHVFVEKPIALVLGEAQELCRLSVKHRRTLMVGHLLQYHAAFLTLKELVDRGELGAIQYIYSNRLNLGRFRREENSLWSFAPHDISMILGLMREEPNHVTAESGTFLQNKIADVTMTHLSFPSGARAHVFVSWLHPIKEQKLVVVGEKAMAVFDDSEPWERKLVLYRQPISWRDGTPTANKTNPHPIAVEPSEPLRNECQHFLNCVRTGARPRTDGEEGIRVLRVLDEAQRSMEKAAHV
ncbi:MAG: Gfo/Idh/MocA family oxidoreductase [Fimbriimonadaceae bacterium]|nr:Gfo/Idh/MocA family oxidoreductase [Alphaproteobacteria bacterium]